MREKITRFTCRLFWRVRPYLIKLTIAAIFTVIALMLASCGGETEPQACAVTGAIGTGYVSIAADTEWVYDYTDGYQCDFNYVVSSDTMYISCPELTIRAINMNLVIIQ